jgi:hypothetical protein
MDEVVAMVEREEIQRIIMGQQAIDNPEAMAFTSNFQNQNPNMEARGATITLCDHCKLKSHKRNKR